MATPDSANLLEARDLVKRFRIRQGLGRRATVTAVTGVSLRVGPGETVALVGESGCGKSTTGRLLLDLMRPDAGTIYFRGRALPSLAAADRRRYRRAVQMVFQNPLAAFNPMLRIGASLIEAMQLRPDLDGPAARAAEARRLLERVGLGGDFFDRFPSQVSGGQLQRAGIARALASEPDVIFLDEPTSALDASIRGQIIELLVDLQQEKGLSYVLVSHDLRLVQALAARVYVMYLGQVVEAAPAARLFARPLHPYTRALLAASAGTGGSASRMRGEVLQFADDYPGCRLADRCPFAVAECRDMPQQLVELAPGHHVPCWRTAEVAATLQEQL